MISVLKLEISGKEGSFTWILSCTALNFVEFVYFCKYASRGCYSSIFFFQVKTVDLYAEAGVRLNIL